MTEHFGDYPGEPKIRDVLEANSPSTFADKVTTPMLIKHSDNDRPTDFVQSEMLVKALKVLNRPVRLEEFFQRYLGENQASHP